MKVRPDKVAPAPKALRLKVAGGCGDGSASRFSIDLDSPGQRKVFKAGKNGLGAELVSF
ncbi:hypothetical protein [Streptomyces sp. Tu102]|uniref:hypothetical protein n=1 Tax=Streptomyces TaxID=1883 RepID=UPI001BDD38B6|nr:hypothetical protein [Streptomyces sp. Tu102]MBT1098353.1 hypothetical protein [Streptomyces sp. Tu102]